MILHQLFITAYRSLAKHKLRSLLTTLGIIIGVVSIIAVSSIGEGAKYKIKQKIESLGTNFIIILGGQTKALAQRRAGGAYLTLTKEDYQSIVEEIDDLAQASPGTQFRAKCVVEGRNWGSLMGGVLDNYLEIRQWNLTKGHFFSRQDVRSSKKVVVLGSTVARELFPDGDELDKTIRINNIPFKVIGILESRGKRPDGTDEDDVMFAPLTTVQRKLRNTTKFGAIIASAKSRDRIGQVAEQIRGLLRQRHNLKPEDDDDFTIFTQDDIAQASDAATAVLNMLLFIIASIALIVGGIGIMNIMLVTVTERKKEIGVRMALGATTYSIRRQFIFEAITICLIGGLIGVAIGAAIAQLIGIFAGWPIFVAPRAITVSLGSSTLIGLFFGYYPAYQASMLNPVEALIER